MKKYFLVVIIYFFSHYVCGQVSKYSLNENWTFHKAGESKWYPATVPGTIHTDLLANKLIDDPFFGENEKKLGWIDSTVWEYRNEFSLPSEFSRSDHLELIFKGLDTYAKVTLNGKIILSADNMFRSYNVDVNKLLKGGKNILFIQFNPAIIEAGNLSKKLPYNLPGGERVFIRKAAYQFGWDWGPKFIGCGIWKPVTLIGWNFLKLENIQVVLEKLDDAIAELKFRIHVNSAEQSWGNCKIINTNTNETFENKIQLNPGNNFYELNISIKNPEKWWTNGLGKPYLYSFVIELSDGKKNICTDSLTYGLRTVELVQEKDSIGQSFYFKVNGIPVFMKGANIIPPDHFIPRAGDKGWTTLVDDASDLNMNMLRVWGGGVYPPDAFYDECDKKGILVWQDFMFACAMYPGDSAFLNNTSEEAKEQIIRLRNHPSLALWCGNNENDEGWKNWDWQKEFHYSEKDSATIYYDYVKLFKNIIFAEVNKEDAGRSYLPSSPSIGWGRKESMLSGDSHYWGVWWGHEPFETYTHKIPRFMSEYGFQSLPCMPTIKSFTDIKTPDVNTPDIINHQKHPTGFQTISEYMNQSYKPAKDFNSYIYLSQLLQADGLRTAIRAHRASMPYCMGSLYWQFNDTWPVASWSTEDYYRRKKAAYHEIQHLYKNILIIPEWKNDTLRIVIASDSVKDLEAIVQVNLVDFNGAAIWYDAGNADLNALSSTMVYEKNLRSHLAGLDTLKLVFVIRLWLGKEVITRELLYFGKPKDLKLSRPAFTIKVLTAQNGHKMFDLYSSVLVKNAELNINNDPSVFSNNYFDMLSNEHYQVELIDTTLPPSQYNRITVRSLIDTFNQ